MAKLTDKQRKRIIAEYVSGGFSQRELSKKYNVSQNTISRILRDKANYQKLSYKKKESEQSMLAFFDGRKEKAQGLIDSILNMLSEDLAKATIKDKAGLLKILSEVFKDTEHIDSREKINVNIKFEDCKGRGEEEDE